MLHFGYHLILAGLALLLAFDQVRASGSMSNRGFMTYTDSKGNVHSMNSDDLFDDSFMMSSDSRGGQQSSMLNGNDDRLDFSNFFKATFDSELARNPADSSKSRENPTYSNGPSSDLEKITFSDGSFIYVPKHSEEIIEKKPKKHSVYYFPRYRSNHAAENRGPRGGSRSPIVVSGGNGADAGSDGFVRVEALDNRPIKVSYQRQQPAI